LLKLEIAIEKILR